MVVSLRTSLATLEVRVELGIYKFEILGGSTYNLGTLDIV